VVEDGRLVGCVTSAEIRDLPREQWSERSVKEILKACGPENTIQPDADSTQALSAMHQNGSSRLMVVENGHLQGIVSLKDLLKFISIKVELESDV
jgi:CBS domain-containing protein